MSLRPLSLSHRALRLGVLLVLACSSGSGTSSADVPARRDRPSHPPETRQNKTMNQPASSKTPADALRDFASDPAANADAEVSYQVGIETWRGGKTTVHLRGSGKVVVANRMGSNERSYSATLSVAELKAVLGVLVENHLTEQRSARATGTPDEARVQLRFHDPAAGITAQNEFWDNERWKNPQLKAIFAQFQKLMKEVSKGNIRY